MSIDITDTTLRLDRDIVTRISKDKNEPQWLTDLRLKSYGLYETLGLPKLEKTKIDKWYLEAQQSYKPENKITSLNEIPENLQELVNQDSENRNLTVQQNSSAVYVQQSEELTSKGVIFTDIDTAIREHGDLVQKYFAQAVKPEENKLTAYHTAIFSGGVFLYVPRNVSIELPIQSLFFITEGRIALVPHILIVAEANSSVTYVDNYVSYVQDSPSVHNGILEVFVGDGAHVRVTSLHDFAKETTDITYRRAIVEKDGLMEFFVGEMSDGNVVADNTTVLKGNGSNSDITTICIGAGEQRINQTSKITHFGTHTKSNMVTHSVMKGKSIGIFNGITKIEKGAAKSNGLQAEKILMLSEKSRGDANPILLVDEEDVLGAGHAASVGQINPDQIYYLMSRGIKRQEAERLIVHGFLATVVSKMPFEGLRDRLVSIIERKLSK
jgi:Fe-S cluster assembly protein SufD